MEKDQSKEVTVPIDVLAQEKIWCDKAFYDKAERKYFEKKAMDKKMVTSRKLVEDCALKSDDSITAKCQDIISTNTLKSKAEKSKDNKLALESDTNVSGAKRSKCQGKAKLNKETADVVCRMQNKENVKVCERPDSAKDNAREKRNASPSEKSKKYNAKEAKEKKNKEDTRNKNRGNEGNERNKEIAMPFVRSKEQLAEQGTRQSTSPAIGSLANEVAKARQHIKESLQCVDDIARIANIANQDMDLASRVTNLEKENQHLKNMFHDMLNRFDPWMKYMDRIFPTDENLEIIEQTLNEMGSAKDGIGKPKQEPVVCSSPNSNSDSSDSELEEENAIKAKNVKANNKNKRDNLATYHAMKAKKSLLSSPRAHVILHVTAKDPKNMKILDEEIRKFSADSLFWGPSQPLIHGANKLEISCIVEIENISMEWLKEQIKSLRACKLVEDVNVMAMEKI